MIAFSISASSVFVALVLVRLFRGRSRQSLPRLAEGPKSDPKPVVKLLSDGSELSAAVERAIGFEQHVAQSVSERLDRYSLVATMPGAAPPILLPVPDEPTEDDVALASEKKRQKGEIAHPQRPMILKLAGPSDPERGGRTGSSR